MKKVESMVTNAVTIDGRMIKLAYWMKHNYGATINQALKTVLPVKETVKGRKRALLHYHLSLCRIRISLKA